ncbi:MAG: hypothetical protein FWD31_04100 [Planctomycetaceae bacterium]|nr:hypothetical protein [Planctomycetaceae bacterium]
MLTQTMALFYVIVVLSAFLLLSSGCGLATHSLGKINKNLPLSPIPKKYSPIQTLVLSPDEKYLIQGQHVTAKEGDSFSGDIFQIWNIEKKKHVLVSRQRANANLAATFSPDGKYVIACGNAGVIRLQVSNETVELVPLEEPKCLSDDGTLVACLINTEWQILSVDAQEDPLILPENVDRFLAFSPDNKYIATTIKKGNLSGSGATVAVWSLREWEEQSEPSLIREISVPNHFPSMEKTRFSPNGRYLALPSRQGGFIGVWDMISGKMHKELGVHDGSIRTLEFSNDSRILAVGTQEASGKYGKVYIWDVISGTMMREPINERQAKGVTALCFASDNETIFIGNSSGEVKSKSIKNNDSIFSFLSQ